MLELLRELRKKVAIGFVGGSDLVKQQEQLGVNGANGTFNLPHHPAPVTHQMLMMMK
jgi:hypothetical protein